MVTTIKFSQMTDGGDLNNNDMVPGLLGGGNVIFNNPWVFLPPGSTADRPPPSSVINYRLRFNTDDQLYEYYDATLGSWTQLQESAFTVGPFLTYTADSSIPDAQNLGALSDGILKQTISAGISTLDILPIPLPGTAGGTGVNNGARTLTLEGSLATSGAFASTFTMTAPTSVTFPTTGTLATTSGVLLPANNLSDLAVVPIANTNLNKNYFVVKLSVNTTNSTGDGTDFIIPFDTVIASQGSGFNTSTGVYTAPYTGLYFFSNTTVPTSIIGVTSGFSQFGSSGGLGNYFLWGQSTAVTNTNMGGGRHIYLTAGQTVWVNINLSGTTKTIGINSSYTFFSGEFMG